MKNEETSPNLALSARFNQRDKIAHLFQLANLGGGEFDFERLFNGKNQPDMVEAIPAVNVPGRQFRRDLNRIFIEHVSENLGEPSVDLWFVHYENSPQCACRIYDLLYSIQRL